MDGDTTPQEPGGSKKGRKTKLTQEVAIGIALLVQEFTHRSVACKRFGISPNTLRTYMRQGRMFPDGIYGQFRALLLDAEAECERKATAALAAAGYNEDPEHLKWLLERRFPERWGRHVGEFARIRKQIKDLERELVKRELQEAQQTP